MAGPEPNAHPMWDTPEPDPEVEEPPEGVENESDYWRGRLHEAKKQEERIDNYAEMLHSLQSSNNFKQGAHNHTLQQSLINKLPTTEEVLTILGTVITVAAGSFTLLNIIPASILEISPEAQITASIALAGISVVVLRRYI